jgi:hypothetical protein
VKPLKCRPEHGVKRLKTLIEEPRRSLTDSGEASPRTITELGLCIMSLFSQLDPQEQAIAEVEYNEWIDQQPEPEPLVIPPTCGQCQYFELREGIWGLCRAKSERDWETYLTVHPSREPSDEVCHLYKEAIPF